MVSHASLLSNLPSNIWPVADAISELIVVCKMICWRPSKDKVYLIFFCSFKLLPQKMEQCPPIRSNPRAPSLQHLLYHFRQLLVGCCVLPLNGGHLWPTHHVSLFFSMCLFLAPQTGKPAIAPPNPTKGAFCRTIGICSAIGWGHCCSTHGDRGEKLLEGRAPVDHFWCLRLCFSNLPTQFTLYVRRFCSQH